MRRRRSALASCVAGAGVLVLLVQAPAPAAGPPVLTTPVQATKIDLDPGRLYSSPAMAVDPKDPMRMVGGWADLRTRRCGLVRTTDGGTTWTRPDASPNTATFPFCSQSQGGVIQAPVAFGGGGMLYMALNGWGTEEAARTGGAVMVARSSDLGDSWETVVVRNAREKTGNDAENIRPVQSIAVDANSGKDDVIYVTFARSVANPPAPNAVPSMPMVAVSRDGGRTFDEAVNLAEGVFESQAIRDQAFAAVTTTTAAPGPTSTTTTVPANSKAATPNQVGNFGSAGSRNGMVARVDPKGNAYVMWPTGTANLATSPPGALALSKSTDGGKTWSSGITIPFSYDNATGGPASAYPQFQISPKTGALHIVYNRNDTPDVTGLSDVFHRVSHDGGATWSEAKDITDDDPKIYGGQFFPNLSIAPNGRIDVAWWDTRDIQGLRGTDAYYAYSTDDGQTWSKNIRLTDRSIDRKLGIWGNNYDIASQPGVASTNAYAVFGWDDTRNSDLSFQDSKTTGGGLQDVYIAAAQFEAIGGGGSKVAKVVLASVVGLLFVGLMLLLGAVVTRRRDGRLSSATAESRADTKVRGGGR
jgi:hypothetical protein